MNERHVINVKVVRKQQRTGLSFRGLFFSFLNKHPHVHSYSMTFFQQTINDDCVRISPMEILLS